MSILDGVIRNAREANSERAGYHRDEEGYLCCGVCGRRREFDVTVMGQTVRVPVICDCDRAEVQKLEEERRAQRRERNRELAFSDKPSRLITFDKDMGPQSGVSVKLRQYARSFTLESKWLVLFGGCGTGKSFYAKCIVNSVIDMGHTAKFITVPEVERRLWNCKNGELYDWLDGFDLLVIDDLFAERDTDYMREIVFTLTDMRSRSGKPVIITTNMGTEGFQKPKDLPRERVVSRLREHALFVPVLGADKRISMNNTVR